MLAITITMAEDLAQLPDLVEERRVDIIVNLLPGLARMAVAPGSRAETQAVCVKIIADMTSVWLGQMTCSQSSSLSLTELGGSDLGLDCSQPSQVDATAEVPSSPSSKSAKVAGCGGFFNRSSTSGTGTGPTRQSGHRRAKRKPGPPGSTEARLLLAEQGRPRRFVIGADGPTIQPPGPEVLVSLVELVNKLLIPYVSPTSHFRLW
ncbi:unnamed protein product [Protopolystoma xenopodis]|uniref:Serine/threonine-protein kinase ULK4/RUNKEL HEAT repeats domain-containing protein n=1 Tax=Protopolystoma xenopodis TaxID=117903 RepID=A0A3S5B7N1_9PLAT|nr:unnamed protein product [Protopolystoma xenopodis]